MRRSIGSLLLLLCLVASPHATAPAQYRSALRVGVTAPGPLTDQGKVLGMRAESRTHWREGATVGAVLGFALGFLMSRYDGAHPSMARQIGLGLVGGAVVMMPGALIGGLFPKRPKPDSTGTARR